MAISSRQIGWGTESNLLWQILKQITRLTSVLFTLKETTTPKYKVYTALLTQSGGDNILYQNDGSLFIGVTYVINDNGQTGDWTNVGAPNNNIGTQFTATGTTPNSWGVNSELQYNTGAPVVKVLENTLGNIWFTYETAGLYKINSNELFINNKTALFVNNISGDEALFKIGYVYADLYSVNLLSFDNTSLSDNVLYLPSPIEIRVYN